MLYEVITGSFDNFHNIGYNPNGSSNDTNNGVFRPDGIYGSKNNFCSNTHTFGCIYVCIYYIFNSRILYCNLFIQGIYKLFHFKKFRSSGFLTNLTNKNVITSYSIHYTKLYDITRCTLLYR